MTTCNTSGANRHRQRLLPRNDYPRGFPEKYVKLSMYLSHEAEEKPKTCECFSRSGVERVTFRGETVAGPQPVEAIEKALELKQAIGLQPGCVLNAAIAVALQPPSHSVRVFSLTTFR